MAKTKSNTNKANTSPVSPTLPEIVYPYTGVYMTSDGIKHEFHYRYAITLTEVGALVTGVVNNVVDDEYGYQPYMRDLVYCNALINYYTDIDIGDIEEVYNLIISAYIEDFNRQVNSNFISDLEHAINLEQISSIKLSINQSIEHKKKILENRSEFDNLAGDLRKIVAAYDEKITKSLKPKTIETFFNNINKLITQYIPKSVVERVKNDIKVVNFAGQQKLDGSELSSDEIESK